MVISSSPKHHKYSRESAAEDFGSKDCIINIQSAPKEYTTPSATECRATSPREQTNTIQEQTNRAKGILWVSIWFMLNVVLAVLMKHIFTSSSFKFPVLMSTVHMIVGTLLSQGVLISGLVPGEKSISKQGEKHLRYFVVLFCLNIAFGNIAVKIVNLPLSQVVRSTIPVFMMIASRLILKVKPSASIVASVVPIVVGVAMTVYGDVELTVLSLFLLIVGNIFAALKVVVTNLYLTKDKLHPMVMLAKLSPMASIVMFAFSLLNNEVSTFITVYNEISVQTYLLVILSGLISFALNWTNFLANMNTSPLTMSVLGNLKQVVLVFLSMFLFGTNLPLFSAVGIAVATAGLMIYSFLKCFKSK
ncbi:sugar phosphate/phosphate translocator [Acrasis kona]|uniref:Sugar phosphate/phosphate translocator n=1 Tax=Acrasis kona TaxID=1008807 RepID=A0AAW2YVK2_9EUKA